MSFSNVLGIDVAKNSVVIFDQNNQRSINVLNTESALLTAISQNLWHPKDCLVALESTGDYSFLPMQIFVKAGFIVKLLNPIVTKKLIKSTIRAKKTDKSDAEAIALMADYGEGRLVTENDLKIAKKTLIRLEGKITSLTSSLKRIKQSLDLKSENGIALDEAVKQIDHLIETAQETAKNIWKLSKNEQVERQEEIISSHIGCGEKLSAIISAEAGDIKRFPSSKQFKAYAGIDPRIYQSGEKDVHGRMTKRGNGQLRRAIYLAAFVASMHDEDLKEYYQKKRGEGKAHTLAVCAVSRKLCERIYATVTQDRLYEPRCPQEEN